MTATASTARLVRASRAGVRNDPGTWGAAVPIMPPPRTTPTPARGYALGRGFRGGGRGPAGVRRGPAGVAAFARFVARPAAADHVPASGSIAGALAVRRSIHRHDGASVQWVVPRSRHVSARRIEVQ